MKRFLPLLLLFCLLLSACGGADTTSADLSDLETKYVALEARCDSLEAANSALQAKAEDLQQQIDALYLQIEALESSSAGAFCNLVVNNWEEQDGALVLTSALFHVQAPADLQIESAQLVMTHNDSEIARVDITLESGAALGSYQLTLNDTWFLLPELQDDDVLDLHPEVVLSSGLQLTGGITSWYAAEDGLSTVVG